MAKHNEVGSWGENLAVELLISKGYAIAETNWRSGHYELDIVAMHDNRVVFVEVKTRSNQDVDPADAVTRKKINRIVKAANAYILAKDLPHEAQYDIITIVGNPQEYTIEHIEDAFMAPLCYR